IGLANTVAVFLLVKRGWKAALPVSIVRVLLSSLMFGNFASFAYSVSGALLSMLAMIAAMKTGKLSEIGVSVIGAVFHNAGQIIMAIALTGTKEIAFWLPPLIISGIVTGIAVGTVAVLLVKKIDLKQ
ncbi:MAG: Gx transporter family protein, partial [Clostridia bacterium]|nr:Gx transporter family protein [Clostridia bacterium]